MLLTREERALMSLDSSTLAIAGGLVAFCSGVFLLIYWWHDPKAWAAFWWALANCGLGVGVLLLGFSSVLPVYAGNVAAPAIIDLSVICVVVAARIFNRRPVKLYWVVASTTVWAAMMALTGIYVREQFAAALGTGVSACLLMVAALEFWLGRSEELPGRKPMIAVVTSHATAVFLVAVKFAASAKYTPLPAINWLGAVHFVALAYAIGTTTFLIMMLKGRHEEAYRIAALTDPLTGLSNRRGFVDRAQRAFDRGGRDTNPVGLIVFDLDRFKRINDTFGHAVGDRVLQAFADALLATLRPTNIVARIGGEEFAAVVPGVGDEVAVAIATRVCDAFQKAAQFVGGQKVEATVSAGVATTGDGPDDVAEMLARADVALYRAKNAGRNRVILAAREPVRPPASNVVRIA
jgi:diguanylate cyclase (GGDEF)-like protein